MASKVYAAKFTIQGLAPISFSKAVESPKDTEEDHAQYEERIWRERLGVNEEGNAIIQPTGIKLALIDSASYLQEVVPGKKRGATYTKPMTSGTLIVEPLVIEPHTTRDSVDGERVFVPSDGKKGGGRRVWKTFPIIYQPWKAAGEITIIDPVITPEKLKEYLNHAGKMIGLGRFRPQNRGWYGRFKVEEFSTSVVTV